MATDGSASETQPPLKTSPPAGRCDDAIYQHGHIVAQVLDPHIDTDAGEIRFGELFASEHLLLPDECEFRRYRIQVRKIGYATKEEKQSLQKGRILRDVTAKIVAYREQ